MSDTGTSFLFLCRKMYFDGYTPSSKNTPTEDYNNLCLLAKQLLTQRGCEGVAYYFTHEDFLIDLWCAHFVLEYGSPSGYIKQKAIDVINKYAQKSFRVKLAQEEKDWLKENGYL